MTTRYPLTLAVNPQGWRVFSGRKDDPAFKGFAEKVYGRDHYICQYCGFQAREYQEVINLDHNYENNKLSNMITACCFCSQCHFIESVGLSGYGGGALIYFPELSQGEINSFCHVLFCAITNDTGYKGTAQSIYRSFKFRAQKVEEQFGEGSSDPAVFGQLIIESQSAEKNLQEILTTDLRLLPSRSKFKMQMERWAETALEELSSEF